MPGRARTLWLAKGDIMLKGFEELLARIESVRRELNEQALHDCLPSPAMLEKSRELDRLLNVYQALKTGTRLTQG